MARIIKTETIETNGFRVVNVYTDNTTKSTDFFENDIVDNFCFTKDKTLFKEKCRIGTVELYYNRFSTKNFVSMFSCINNDAVVRNVTLDFSEELKSNICKIPARDILEYEADKEVKKVNIIPLKKVKLSILLSDESTSEVELQEGMDLFNVTIQRNGKETTENYKVLSFLYNAKIRVVNKPVIGLALINSDGDIEKVNFEDIKICGKKGTVVTETDSITNVLNAYYTDKGSGGLVLPATTFNDAITLKEEIVFAGVQASVAANTGVRATDEVLEDETVLANTINCTKNANVTIQGITLSNKANIKVNGAKTITFKNCRFLAVEPTGVNSYLLTDTFNSNDENGVLLQIENCYFGTNVVTENGKTYNLFELNCKLADGSYIKNNYFAKAACTHNVINLYDVMPEATIEISSNHFEYSANAVRIGFIGDPDCTINIFNNTYDDSDNENPEWAGLLLIQPYGVKTTSFGNLKVYMKRNKCTKKGANYQDWYLYCGESDTHITGDLYPQVYIDGVLQEEPIIEIPEEI